MAIWKPTELDAEIIIDISESTITLDSGVSEIEDLSGNGNNLTQSSTSAQPVINSAALNGYDTLSFNGTSHFMQLLTPAGLGANDEKHIFMVVVAPSTLTVSTMVLSTRANIGGVDNSSKGYICGIGSNGVVANGSLGYRHTGAGIYFGTNSLSSSDTAIVDFHSEADGSDVQIHLNGVLETASTDTLAVGTDEAAGGYTTLGVQAGTEFSKGDLAALVVKSGAFTTEELEKLQGWAAHKFGLEDQLDSSHAYRFIPPGTYEGPLTYTIPSSKVSTSQEFIPIKITLSDSCGTTDFDTSEIFWNIKDDWGKLSILDSDGNRVYFEVVYWDHISNFAILWILLYSLPSGSDTTLYFHYKPYYTTAEISDSFTGANGDFPNKEIWNTVIGSTGEVSTIFNNKLHIVVDSTAVSRNVSQYYFPAGSDFTVQVDFFDFLATGTTGLNLMDFLIDKVGDPTTYAFLRVQKSATTLTLNSAVATSGAGSGNSVSLTNDYGSLRIARVGSTWTLEASIGGGAWTTIYTVGSEWTDAAQLTLRGYSESGQVSFDFDNFVATSADAILPKSFSDKRTMAEMVGILHGSAGDSLSPEFWNAITATSSSSWAALFSSGNVFDVELTAGGANDNLISYSCFDFKGDFEISVEFANLVSPSSSGVLCAIGLDGEGLNGSWFGPGDNAGNKFRGVLDGSAESTATRSYDYGKLFIKRVGSTLSYAYENGPGSRTTFLSNSSVTTNPLRLYFFFYVYTVGKTLSVSLSNFRVEFVEIDTISGFSGSAGDIQTMKIWDNDYSFVSHMAQDPSGTAPQIKDSAPNQSDGTSYGTMTASDLVIADIGPGLSLDGVDDHVDFGYHSSHDLTEEMTLEVVFAFENQHDSTASAAQTMVDRQYSGAYDSYLMQFQTDGRVKFGTNGGNIQSTKSVWDAGVSYDLAVTFKDDLSSLMMIDGVAETLYIDNYDTMVGSATPALLVGAQGPTKNYPFKGTIFEVRISSVARSDSWLALMALSARDALGYFIIITGESEGSSGGAIPSLPVLRKTITFPYALMDSLRTIVTMPYGIKIAKIINFVYGDAEVFRKIVNMPYDDAAAFRKIINMKYGDAPQFRKIVEMLYQIRGQLRKIVDMPYHISEAELKKIINLPYDLSLYDELRKIVAMPYSIITDEAIEETTVFSATTNNGYEFNPHHVNIEDDEELAYIDYEMHSKDPIDYEEAKPLPDEKTYINVILNSDEYYFIIEERNEREGKFGTSFTIKAASPTVLLDLPYAKTFSEELSGMASDIVRYLVAKESDTIQVVWELLDWYIPPGILLVSEQTPMPVIEQIVLAAGGIRQSTPSGDLLCRPLYPVNIPDYETTQPAAFFTDQDNFYYVDSTTYNKEGYNNFLIGSEESTVENFKIWTEEISPSKAQAKVTQIPFSDDNVVLSTSGGSWVGISFDGVVEEQIVDELVEIVDGQGDTEYPIYELYPDSTYSADSPDYRETNLGSITFDEDGTILTATTKNTLVMLSYKTKYYSYTVNDPNIEVVQLYPEIL